MKNIGILGFGNVGRATAKYLEDSERRFVVYDEDEAVQKAANKDNGYKKNDHLDALIVCVGTPHPLTVSLKHADFATIIAEYLRTSMDNCSWLLLEGAPILVRTTVPPGTCDALQLLLPNNPVLAWPEFSKEQSMRQGFEIKAPYLGLNPSVFDDDESDGLLIAAQILKPCELDAELLSSNLYQNKQVEFIKLAWNVRRAADVAVFNQLAHAGVNMGFEPVTADFLTEQARPHHPHFSTLAFGGACLDKDLWIWDHSTNSTLGLSVRTINRAGPHDAVNMAFKAHALLNLDWTQRPVILGLQDGPGSKSTHHSPAMQMQKARKWHVPPVYVDPVKSVCSRFWQLLVRGGHEDHASCAAPESILTPNMIIIAQSSHDHSIYHALLKILQNNDQPIKLVVNGAGQHFTEREYIECIKHGAVFVDQTELKRMLAEHQPKTN